MRVELENAKVEADCAVPSTFTVQLEVKPVPFIAMTIPV
jgi:hypothetical protein